MKISTFLILMAILGVILQNREKIAHKINPPPAITHLSADTDVVLYSTTWCGYCKKTREYFAENHIPYTDIDVEQSAEGRRDYDRLGRNGVPIVVINNATTIHGYSPEMISDALNKSQSPATVPTN